MKTRLRIHLTVLAALGLGAGLAQADNSCIETGPHTNAISCVQSGTFVPGVLTPTNIAAVVGQPVTIPVATGYSITNGLQYCQVTNDCPETGPNYYVTNAVPYAFGNPYFIPVFPSVFWTPGSFTFTDTVVATGGPCWPLTNLLGTVTVTIATNTPDVLLNADFGIGPSSSMTGYAEIGDSPADFWNEYDSGCSGILTNLVTANGIVSPVALLVNGLSVAGTNGSSDAMYNDYLYASAEVATFTITNLPAGTWNVYLYSDDGNFDLAVSDANNYLIKDYGTQTCHDASPNSAPLAWQQGVQYVLFTNVILGSSQTLTVSIKPGTSGAAVISGLQIGSANHIVPPDSLLSGLVAWWRAEDNSLDSIGTNNGTPVGALSYANGEVGQAFSLDGTSSYVNVPSSPSLKITGAFTVEGWINLNSWPAGSTVSIVTKGQDANAAMDWAMGINDGKLWGAVTVGWWQGGDYTTTLATGVWYHVAMSFDGTNLLGYVNGALDGTYPISGTSVQATDYALRIGAYAPVNGTGGNQAFFPGRVDELSVYNRALSQGEIQAIYNDGSQGKTPNPMQDTDYDGVSDLHELADRTNPDDPNSVLHILLGYWPFDDTNTWAGSAGQLPLLATNVVGVPSWDTNAVLIDSLNPAILCYRDVETNGNANINLRSGTVQFWFKPDWSSVCAGGSGPGAYGRLIEMGHNKPVFNNNSWVVFQTNGWWAMYLTPDGNTLDFGSSTNGFGGVNLSANIAWTSNVWHQVVLTYSPTNSSLYLDGQFATNGAASSHYPNLTERSSGFRIGSDQNGTNQARGTFDDLQTFNYPLSAAAVATNYLSAVNWSGSGDGLPNFWQLEDFDYVGVDPNGNPAGDGLSNLQKYEENLNPDEFYPTRLGYWRFNNPPFWLDESNLTPSTVYGLYPVPSWSGDAVSIIPAQNSVLAYPGVRTNGSAVAICPAGTGSIRFWFRPYWSSYDGLQNVGPGSIIRLFEVGEQSTNAAYGWFALWVNSWGTQLTLSTEANGVHTDNASCSINFTTNSWSQIVLTFTASNSVIYVNGIQVSTNDLGVTNLPSQAVLQQGFHLGCSWDGVDQANGCFDELETFNYPLAASDVLSNYQAIMSIDTYGTGLPDVVKNAYGLNPTSVDSDCDGLPDAWKIANGLNPLDPTVATTAVMQEYEGITGVSTGAYAHVISPGDIIDIDFTCNTTVASTNVYGPAAAGYGPNDLWNFFDANADFLNNGQALKSADNSQGSAKLFAYLGPCRNGFVDANADYVGMVADPGGEIDQDEPTAYASQYPFSYLEDGYNNSYIYPTGYYFIEGTSDPWYDVAAGYVGPGWPYGLYGVDNLLDFYGGSYHDAYLFSEYPSDYGITSALDAVFSATDYANYLYNLMVTNANITNRLTPYAAENCVPEYDAWGHANCYVPAFSSATSNLVFHAGDNLMESDGVCWNCALTNADVDLFSVFYGQAARNLLIAGLTNATYQVYVYFDGATNSTPPSINGTHAVLKQTVNGGSYWYARVASAVPGTSPWQGYVALQDDYNWQDYVNALAPPWATIASTPGDLRSFIQIALARQLVPDPDQDIKLLGLQIVKLDTATAPVLEVQPGLAAAYLAWQPSATATNYNIYRQTNSANGWTKIASTSFPNFQDTNLFVGMTYYYEVVAVNELGTSTNSQVVSVVPFGCSPPLPPRIDYVNPLQLAANNGTYAIGYGMLLTNSDALDPQGYPMVFKVSSVLSGSLMIDGLPFSSANNTIGGTNVVIWTPPAMMAAAGTPAFTVYVFDGVNRSSNTVNVVIQQHPQTNLYGWGANFWGAVGVGTLPRVLDFSNSL